MRIFWMINTILPCPAKKLNIKSTVFGGWINSLLNQMEANKNIKEIFVATTYNGKTIKKFKENKVIYYLLPVKNVLKYQKDLSHEIVEVYKEINPDVVHVHGTEYPHSLSAIEAAKYCNIKTVVSIQGLASECGIHYNYFAGMTFKELLLTTSFRDIVKFEPLFLQALKLRKRGKYEKKCLLNVDGIIGRTSWDLANVYSLNCEKKYYTCNESLRESFYKVSWDINNIERNSIFVSQASYPLKGFHKILLAARIIKKEYPDLKIYVAGDNITKNNCSFKEKIKMTGYGKYIKSKIKEYDLQDNVFFTGLLTEEKMTKKMLKSHVFVQASSIENSSNSLGEAMLISMPCVASYVGGTSDLLRDKEEGFLYPFLEYKMLAKYIIDIFRNDSLAITLGKSAHVHAADTHSVEKNSKKMFEIYRNILGGKYDKKD